MTKWKSIDLFAGIGGIRLGFEQAFGDDIETIFISEIDRFANQTYYANFGEDVKISGDITKISADEVPEHNILLAGFPCQAFSVGGKKKGFLDNYKGRTRGTLFFDIMRIVDKHHPEILFLENVKHLVRHDSGRTFKIMTNALDEAGYKIFWKILDSKDFGVPQSRQRTYIVCFRKDIAPEDFTFPEPVSEKNRKKIKDIKESKVASKFYISETYMAALERHKQRHESRGHGFGYVVRDENGIFGTLTCSGSGKEQNILEDPNGDIDWSDYKKGTPNEKMLRVPTPREFARGQGFPDSFVFPVSDTQAYRQFGNSVSVPVIKAIASRLKLFMDEFGEKKEKEINI